jgi:transcriptional regulator with XRE-family HTH domain
MNIERNNAKIGDMQREFCVYGEMARKPVFKTPLGRRLAEIREERGIEREEMASILGNVSASALANYERGDNVPDANILAAYHSQIGVNITWLLTGSGEMYNDPSNAPPPATVVDPLLMEKLYKAVERVYRDAGQRPPGHRIANEATELLNLLLEKVTDVRDELIVDAVIPALAQKLVDDLAEAAAKPGTGKLSA